MLLKFDLHKRLGVSAFIVTARYPATSRTTHEENIISFVVWLVTVIFVKSQLSSKSLFVRECWK
jgi:hypothetical protein